MTIQEFANKYTDKLINSASAPNLVHSQIVRDGFVVLATQAEQFNEIVHGLVHNVMNLVPGFIKPKESAPPAKVG